MELDQDKIDDAVLALLRLTRRAAGRKGLIANPVGKAKSVVLTDEGLERSAALLEVLFAKNQSGG